MTSPEKDANEAMAGIMSGLGYSEQLFRQDLAEATDIMDDLIQGSVENFRAGAEAPAVYAAINIALNILGAGEVIAMMAADITVRAQQRMLQEEIDGISEGE